MKRFRNFRDLLKDELEIRTRKNPQYSLRALARDLDVAPSRLSEIIRGRRGLSVRTLGKIAAKLNLSLQEKAYYTLRAQLALAKDPKKKKTLKRELKELEMLFSFHELPVETQVPLTWLHSAILEAVDLPGFEPGAEWIAQRFGVDVNRAAKVLEALKESGLLTLKGDTAARISRLVKFVPAPGIDAIEVRRKDFAQLLDRAKQSILEEQIGTFLSNSQYMKLPESCLDDVRALIQEFKNKIVSYYESAKPTEAGADERVYCLNINFIPLDKKN